MDSLECAIAVTPEPATCDGTDGLAWSTADTAGVAAIEMGAEMAGGAAGVGCGAGAAFLRERRPIAVTAYARLGGPCGCRDCAACRAVRMSSRSQHNADRGGWKAATSSTTVGRGLGSRVCPGR